MTRSPNSKPAVRVLVGAGSVPILPAASQRYSTWIVNIGPEPVFLQNRLPATVATGFPLAMGAAKLINSVEVVNGISAGGGGVVAVWEDEGEYVAPGGGGGGGTSSGLEADTHYSVSRKDFTATLKPASTDTLLLVFPPGFFVVDDENIETVTVRIADGHEVVYDPENYAFVWNAGLGELQVVGAVFGPTDLDYDVDLLGPPRVPAKRADGATTVATTVSPTQNIGQDGKATPSGFDVAHPVFVTAAGGAGAAGGGPYLYLSPQDFTAAFLAPTQLDLTNLTFAPVIEQFLEVVVIQNTGVAVSYNPNTNAFTWVPGAPGTGVLTVAGAVFAGTDQAYRVVLVGPDKCRDAPTDTFQTYVTNAIPAYQNYQTVANVALGLDGTYDYYLDAQNFDLAVFQLILNGGSGTIRVSLAVSAINDGTLPAACAYQDVTNALFGYAAAGASTLWSIDQPLPVKYLRIRVVAATGANDASWAIYAAQSH